MKKNIIICVLCIFLKIHIFGQCERFFSYENNSVNVSLLGLEFRKKSNASDNFNAGSINVVKTSAEVSDKLKELDLLQYILCQKLEELPNSDPDKNSLRKKVIEVFLQIIKTTYIGNEANIPEMFLDKNKGIPLMTAKELEYLRGKRDGYAFGFIMGKIAQYYREQNQFPETLEYLQVDTQIEALGIDKISYAKTQDDFILRFAGKDKVLLTADDKVRTKKDIRN